MNRRNKKYRILYDAFDAIDGKPIRANDYSYDRVILNNFPLLTFPFYKKKRKENWKFLIFQPAENPHTPRFSRNIRTPSKSKTNLRAPSLDRKTPTSMADESEFNADKYENINMLKSFCCFWNKNNNFLMFQYMYVLRWSER